MGSAPSTGQILIPSNTLAVGGPAVLHGHCTCGGGVARFCTCYEVGLWLDHATACAIGASAPARCASHQQTGRILRSIT